VINLRPVFSATSRDFSLRPQIDRLEEELITALYRQREYESDILAYSPQSTAPPELVSKYFQSKIRVQGIQGRIRRLKYDF
jgi:hypothetical protein